MSDRLSYQQQAILNSACNAFVVRQGWISSGFRITHQQVIMVDDAIMFVMFGLEANVYYHFDLMAVITGEQQCTLFLEASSSVSITTMNLQNKMESHEHEYPHSIGI